jgi:Bacterial regulatory helix-turn-helix protein, lysR family
MLSNMKLSVGDLEAAVKVTEYGHFTRAGEKINRSQTSVSKGVRRVEQTLEAELLDRKARPVGATRSGEIFSYQMRKALYFIGARYHRRETRGPFDWKHAPRWAHLVPRSRSAEFAAEHRQAPQCEVLCGLSQLVDGRGDCQRLGRNMALRLRSKPCRPPRPSVRPGRTRSSGHRDGERSSAGTQALPADRRHSKRIADPALERKKPRISQLVSGAMRRSPRQTAYRPRGEQSPA